MLTRLVRKAKERKKDKCARDKQPAEHLKAVGQIWLILPNKGRELGDRGIVGVYLGPVPRYDITLCSEHDEINPQRNGPEYLDGGKGHQAKVPATIGTIGRRHNLAELTSALVECEDGHDWI
jgi:hypothetical protein